MARPLKHDTTTREHLLDAAERLLQAGGAEAISVRAVADEIGESTRAVYSVFGSKEALLAALASRGFGYLADLVEVVASTEDAAHDLVTCGLEGFRTFAIGRPHLFRITFERMSADVRADPGAYHELMRAFGALFRRVQRLVDEGSTDHAPLVVAFGFHSVCQGLAESELSHEPPPVGAGAWTFLTDFDGRALWEATLTAYVTGLADPRSPRELRPVRPTRSGRRPS